MSQPKLSVKTCVYSALAASLLCAAAAGAKPTVTIGNPMQGSAVSDDEQVIIVFASEAAPATLIELYIDSQKVFDKKLKKVAAAGAEEFTFDTKMIADGLHTLSTRVYDTKGEFGFASVTIYVANNEADTFPPTVNITNPKPDQTVSGNVQVTMAADDNKLLQFVTLLIDGGFKYLGTAPPFRYLWDTTKEKNGGHTLLAKAYDASKNEGVSPPVVVTVANEGGKTTMQPRPLFRAADGNATTSPIIKPVEPAGAAPDVKSIIEDPGVPTTSGPGTAALTPSPKAETTQEPKPTLTAGADPTSPLTTTTRPEPETPAVAPRVAGGGPSGAQVAPPAPSAPVRIAKANVAEVEPIGRTPQEASVSSAPRPTPEEPSARTRRDAPTTSVARSRDSEAGTLTVAVARSNADDPQLAAAAPPETASLSGAPAQSGPQAPGVPRKATTPQPTAERKTVAPAPEAVIDVAVEATTAAPQATSTSSNAVLLAMAEVGRAASRQPLPRPNAPETQSRAPVRMTRVLSPGSPVAPPRATGDKPPVDAPAAPRPESRTPVVVDEPPAPPRVAVSAAPSRVEPVSDPGRRAPLIQPTATVAPVRSPGAMAVSPRIARAGGPEGVKPFASQPAGISPYSPTKVGRAKSRIAPVGSAFPEAPVTREALRVAKLQTAIPEVRGGTIAVPAEGPTAVRRSYTIQSGDNLTLIAKRFGVPAIDLALTNDMKDPNLIRPGHSLVIPNRSLKVFYDSHPIKLDVAAFVMAGVPVAPFRAIFEHAGGTVLWHHEDKSVEAKRDDQTIELKIGSRTAKINGEAVLMDLAALLKQNRTVVPTSLFGEALDVVVHFDAGTGNIRIASK